MNCTSESCNLLLISEYGASVNSVQQRVVPWAVKIRTQKFSLAGGRGADPEAIYVSYS